MPQLIYAGERLTFKYQDGWSHEDEWSQPRTFKLLGAPKATRPSNGIDDGGAYRLHVVGDKRADRSEQKRALAAYFGGSQCRHEYDCCGCATRSVEVLDSRKPGRFSVLVDVSYNY